jgi:hypothetical protein
MFACVLFLFLRGCVVSVCGSVCLRVSVCVTWTDDEGESESEKDRSEQDEHGDGEHCEGESVDAAASSRHGGRHQHRRGQVISITKGTESKGTERRGRGKGGEWAGLRRVLVVEGVGVGVGRR